MDRLLTYIGNWNPQLFRELKGRFQPRKLFFVVGISFSCQLLMYLYYLGILPDPLQKTEYSHYCTGYQDEYWQTSFQCFRDASNNWVINWQLWNFDLFTAMVLISISLLLVVGCYLITSDLAKEEKRGTLGFVRLSPQPVHKIIIGKILGVPALLYLGIALVIPFNLSVGAGAHIPLPWIALTYALGIAACVCFYSVAALFSFVGKDFLGGFQAWLCGGMVGLYLMFTTLLSFESSLPFDTAFDWLRMFYPGTIFYYLVDQSSLASDLINYFEPQDLFATLWYQNSLWYSSFLGLGFVFINYLLVTCVAWQGIRRRFYEPNATLINKKTAYLVAIGSMVIATGFACGGEGSYKQITENIALLQLLHLFLFLGLTIALTPERQLVQDWARYRHQGLFSRHLWVDLLWGEKSPAFVAIAVAALVTTGFVAVIELIHNHTSVYRDFIFVALVLQLGTLIIYGAIAQLVLLMRRKQTFWLILVLGSLIIVPMFVVALFHDRSSLVTIVGLLSAVPLIVAEQAHLQFGLILWSIAGQSIGAAYLVWLNHRQIKRLGESATKRLLAAYAETKQNMLL